MPAEPKPAPTERGASDEAEREAMSIEIEDGDAEAKKAEEATAESKAAEEATDTPADEGEGDEKAAAGADEPAEADSAAEAEAKPEEGAADEAKPAEEDASAQLQKELDAAKAEAKEWQDKFLRLHAEWDTYRRRTAEERETERARAAEKLVVSLLPVVDDFERTISYAQDNGETGLLDGVRAVHTKLVDVLAKDGVEVIDPADAPFDALEHQAVATVDDSEAYDETVRDVYQKGYKLGGKVLRPAMVTVTTGGPKRPKEEPAEEE